MTNQQGAPEALTDFEHRHAIRQGYEIAASDRYFEARQQIDSNDRRKVFQAGFERGWDRLAALVEAQQPATHVQNPAEIEHVADDVSKNGAETNMAPQPAPSAASKAVLAAIRAANMQLVRTGDDEFMLVTYKNAKAQCDGGKCGIGGYCDDCPTPQADSQPAKFTEIIQSWCGARYLPMPSADDCQSLLLSWEAARTQADSQPAQFVDQTSANLSDKAVCASTVIDKPARDRTPEDSVLEDAARYRFLRDGEWRDTDLEPFIRLQLNTLWAAKIDAARKQGANHD